MTYSQQAYLFRAGTDINSFVIRKEGFSLTLGFAEKQRLALISG